MLFYSLLISILHASCSVVLIILISKFRNTICHNWTTKPISIKTSHKKLIGIVSFNFFIVLITYQKWIGNINFFTIIPMMIYIILADVDILTFFLPFELLFVLLLTILLQIQTAQQWIEKGIGFLSVAIILCLIYFFHNRSAQKKEVGFGFGDVLYGSCIGLNLGWYGGLYSISYGLIIAGIYAAILMLLGKEKNSRIPLSPFFLMGVALFERI